MVKSHAEILKQFRKHKALADSGLKAQRELARECNAFYVGDTMKYSGTVGYTDNTGRRREAMVEFNRVKPYINAVAGFMLQNRRRAKYIARLEGEDAQRLFTEYCNSIADYLRENGNADMVENEICKQMLINGVGAVETCLSYGDGYSSVDVNGEVVWTPIPLQELMYDPRARRNNLLDARFVGYTKEFDLEEALELFDASEEDDFEGGFDEENSGNGRVFDPERRRFLEVDTYDWANEERDLVKVHFYQWYEVEKFYRCENPAMVEGLAPDVAQYIASVLMSVKSGVDDDDFDPSAEIIVCSRATRKMIDDALPARPEWYDIKRKVFYTAVLSGKKVFNAYKSISQQGFSVKFITGDWDEQRKVWDGMVSAMRTPVRYYNKTLTELMFTIATNSKGGWFVEENAVKDIREFEANVGKTDSVVMVKQGSLSNGSIQSKTKPFQPTGYENIVSISDAAIGDVTGIDKTFLGNSDNKQETAMLQRQRVSQVVSTLAGYFDAIGLYQKLNARLLLDLMRVYAEGNPNALVPIVGEDGKQEFLRLSATPFMAEYTISIQEAPISAYEKQELSSLAMNMGQALMTVGDLQAGKAMLALAVKNTMFDDADKEQVMQLLLPQDGDIDPAYVQQLEQMVQQLQSEATQVQLRKVATDAELNQARAHNTLVDAQKKAAETVNVIASAEKTEADTEKVRVETNAASMARDVRIVI